MRRLLLAVVVFCSVCLGASGEEKVKMLFRDYKLTDVDTRPLSMGVVWSDNKELPSHLGAYCSVGLLSYKDWRLEIGGSAVNNEIKNRMEPNLLTGVSVRLWERCVVGVWYAPFWNLFQEKPDDPWGVMIGYAFPTP